MGQINWGRVIGGGLLAGLVMNIGEAALHGGLLGEDDKRLFESLGVSTTPEPWQLIALIGMTFVLGITSVWLYAAIRPRYGAGPTTAICAGLAVWVFAHVWAAVYMGAAYNGVIPPKQAWLPVVWGLFEAPLGTLAGAWLYKE